LAKRSPRDVFHGEINHVVARPPNFQDVYHARVFQPTEDFELLTKPGAEILARQESRPKHFQGDRVVGRQVLSTVKLALSARTQQLIDSIPLFEDRVDHVSTVPFAADEA
jgi:hypothetical protein